MNKPKNKKTSTADISFKKPLQVVEMVFEKAKNCKLEPSFWQMVDKELSFLSRYFCLTKRESFWVSLFSIFAINSEDKDDRQISYKKFGKHLKCKISQIMFYYNDFETLSKKNILLREELNLNNRDIHFLDILWERKILNKKYKIVNMGSDEVHLNKIVVNSRIVNALIRNQPMPEVWVKRKREIEDSFDFLHEFFDFLKTFDNNLNSVCNGVASIIVNSGLLESFYEKIKLIWEENKHLSIVRHILGLDLTCKDKVLYFWLIGKSNEKLNFYQMNTDDIIRLSFFKTEEKKRIHFKQSFISGEHPLIKYDLVQLAPTENSPFSRDIAVTLTNKACGLLKKCGIHIIHKSHTKNITPPEKIKIKNLFFNKTLTRDLDWLREMLSDKNFKKVQNRLEAKNLPKGVVILLYGAPGTGKTETAYQIAKATGREMMKVDIASSKSMWFGESEKIVKRIFNDYQFYNQSSAPTPILLFNEADAIISRRVDVGNSNTGKTENTIQNILLEEMENFEGIFFATSNLIENIDSAFERRFLFKIKFDPPDADIKAKIWSDKLPTLTAKECRTLAWEFDFSGGEIDNVVRKKEMHEIIHNSKVSFERLVEFCRAEKLHQQSNGGIGFTSAELA